MIEKNYIILAHKNPKQLDRLINKLDDGYSYFFIHIDNKKNISEFLKLSERKNVYLINNRVNYIYCHFSSVQAIINCIREIIKMNKTYYTILLSGQCYPIVDKREINNYLENNIDFDHIDISPVEKEWPDEYYLRLTGYMINLSDAARDYLVLPYFFESKFKDIFKNIFKVILYTYKRRNINILLSYFRTFRKRRYNKIKHFGGLAWWALRYETLIKVLDFINNNKDFVDFHKNTHIPDEIFFNSIIEHLSSKNIEMKIKPSLTYTDWSKGGISPALFNQSDFEKIKIQTQNGKLFARKFDIEYCDKILDLIDEQISADQE